jgi:hypothetical protein
MTFASPVAEFTSLPMIAHPAPPFWQVPVHTCFSLSKLHWSFGCPPQSQIA